MNLGLAHTSEDESGFTLVEVIVAATIFFLAAVSLLTMTFAGQQWATRAQERENLVNFTAGYMERIRGLSYSEIGTVSSSDPTGSVTTTSAVVGAYTVQVVPTISWVTTDAIIPGPRDYKLVTLTGTAFVTGTGANRMTNTLESIISSVGVR